MKWSSSHKITESNHSSKFWFFLLRLLHFAFGAPLFALPGFWSKNKSCKVRQRMKHGDLEAVFIDSYYPSLKLAGIAPETMVVQDSKGKFIATINRGWWFGDLVVKLLLGDDLASFWGKLGLLLSGRVNFVWIIFWNQTRHKCLARNHVASTKCNRCVCRRKVWLALITWISFLKNKCQVKKKKIHCLPHTCYLIIPVHDHDWIVFKLNHFTKQRITKNTTDSSSKGVELKILSTLVFTSSKVTTEKFTTRVTTFLWFKCRMMVHSVSPPIIFRPVPPEFFGISWANGNRLFWFQK